MSFLNREETTSHAWYNNSRKSWISLINFPSHYASSKWFSAVLSAYRATFANIICGLRAQNTLRDFEHGNAPQLQLSMKDPLSFSLPRARSVVSPPVFPFPETEKVRKPQRQLIIFVGVAFASSTWKILGKGSNERRNSSGLTQREEDTVSLFLSSPFVSFLPE